MAVASRQQLERQEGEADHQSMEEEVIQQKLLEHQVEEVDLP